jgi:hypothetical protein
MYGTEQALYMLVASTILLSRVEPAIMSNDCPPENLYATVLVSCLHSLLASCCMSCTSTVFLCAACCRK